MARLPRLAIADHMHYLCQTGHSGGDAFLDEQDASVFLATLRDAASRHAVQLHAYMVLSDKYGLLVTPNSQGALSAFVQALGRSYARHFNKRYQRSGALWNGRFQATVLQADLYHHDVMTWMAMQSSKASATCGWSLLATGSGPHYLGEMQERCLTPHPIWWTVGNTPFERESAFRQRMHEGLSDSRAEHLSRALGHEWVLGNAEFLASLSSLTDRRLAKGKPGRPRINVQR